MVVDPKKRKGLLLFGWCAQYTEDHDNCRVSFVDQNGTERICQCKCHRKSSSAQSRNS